MHKSLLIAAAVASSLMLTACHTQETKSAAMAKSSDQMAYEKALMKAKGAQKSASKLKGEWRDTGKLIKKAEGAAKKGDYAKASKLAAKAEAQGHIAASQAKANANAGNPAYLYE